jgi:hypothetical protein
MSRIALTCCFAALLGSCGPLGVNNIDWEHARLACADVGIEPGTSVVLGYDPSDRRYDTCIRSLDRSLAEWDQSQAVQSVRRACSEKGLEPGTPAFAVGVVTAEQSPTNFGGYGEIVPTR